MRAVLVLVVVLVLALVLVHAFILELVLVPVLGGHGVRRVRAERGCTCASWLRVEGRRGGFLILL